MKIKSTALLSLLACLTLGYSLATTDSARAVSNLESRKDNVYSLMLFAQNDGPDTNTTDLEENPIIIRLVDILNFLIFGVGIVVGGTIIVSGLQYMTSQGNPQKTAAARDKIIMALIGLALYSMAFVILQWLIPGGVFD